MSWETYDMQAERYIQEDIGSGRGALPSFRLRLLDSRTSLFSQQLSQAEGFDSPITNSLTHVVLGALRGGFKCWKLERRAHG